VLVDADAAAEHASYSSSARSMQRALIPLPDAAGLPGWRGGTRAVFTFAMEWLYTGRSGRLKSACHVIPPHIVPVLATSSTTQRTLADQDECNVLVMAYTINRTCARHVTHHIGHLCSPLHPPHS